jgi:hypothetical protein
VSTSYNSFNTDFYLLYQKSNDVRTCFYVNFRLNVKHWSINYALKNVCFFRLRTANDRWINIHNVYNASSDFYVSRFTLSIVKTLERQLNDSEKHIVLRDFNLHHFLWSDFAKHKQHNATNQLLNVVHRAQFRFILSSDTVTWKTKQTCSIIDLIFMFEEFRNELMHCMTRSKLNQSSNHISIFTKIMLAMKLKTKRQSKTWKKIDVEKLNNNWRDFVVLSSLICREHVENTRFKLDKA